MPDLICSNCHAPHTIAVGVDPDRYAGTIGMSRMPSIAICITARDAGPTGPRVTNAIRMFHAPGATLAHESDGRASWLLDAPPVTAAMAMVEMAAGLGLIVDTAAVPPFPGAWFCGLACRAQAFTRETAAPDTCHDGGTARTRALLAAKGPVYDPQHDPELRITCPTCGQSQAVPPLADPAKYLVPLGWRVSKARDRMCCSLQCSLAAPAPPPVDTAAVAAADRAFVGVLQRERAAHAPALKSDATTPPGARKGPR